MRIHNRQLPTANEFEKIVLMIPRATIFLLALLLAWITISRPYNNSPPIRSDGAGYHIWVHGIKNLDFTFCEYRAILDPTLSISYVNEEKKICGIKYPPGVGLFQLPIVYHWSRDKPEKDFSRGAHTTILWIGSALLILSCGLSYYTLARLGCSPLPSLLATAAFTFGSGLFHYATYDASFSHVYSTFGTAALLWLMVRHQDEKWTLLSAAILGMLIFWLHLVRQTNIIITLVAILTFLQKQGMRNRITTLATWGSASAVALSIQLLYNQYVTGQLRLSSYGQESFVGVATHFGDVLLSYERGLFTYYPIFLLTILLAAWKCRSRFFMAFTSLVIAFTALYGSWHSWFLGGGMGHRGFVELAPFGILALGTSLDKLQGKARYIACATVAACCYVTIAVMLHYWQGNFPFAGATPHNYWSAVTPCLGRPH
jgi:hypothetical protein